MDATRNTKTFFGAESSISPLRKEAQSNCARLKGHVTARLHRKCCQFV